MFHSGVTDVTRVFYSNLKVNFLLGVIFIASYAFSFNWFDGFDYYLNR